MRHDQSRGHSGPVRCVQRATCQMIPWPVILQGGAVGILAGVVWMIVTGKLVPRAALDDAREQRDSWRAACERAMEQNHELLTGARVTRDLISALPDAAGQR